MMPNTAIYLKENQVCYNYKKTMILDDENDDFFATKNQLNYTIRSILLIQTWFNYIIYVYVCAHLHTIQQKINKSGS